MPRRSSEDLARRPKGKPLCGTPAGSAGRKKRDVSAVPSAPSQYYDPGSLEDAPEFHLLSRSLGLLTWGTWDDGSRSVEDRIKDFVSAFPPADPTRHMTGRLERQQNGSFAPGRPEGRLARFLERSWASGSFYELLSRYGLSTAGAPTPVSGQFAPDAARDAAKRRNVRLRVLHGSVDIEPQNMTAAKADYVDREEKRRAAAEVRAARSRLKDELSAERARGATPDDERD